jgi:hypothetical protein
MDEYVDQVLQWLYLEPTEYRARVLIPGIRALYGLNFGWYETAKICLNNIRGERGEP